MMYAYYALALMKVSCPWKRYLTQAQLLQFTSVVIYSIATLYQHYMYVPHEAIEGEQPSLSTYCFCAGVQVFEMVSLFCLFSLFYKKKYSKNDKKGSKKESESEDECHKAMAEISTAAKEAAGHAAKDAGKVLAAVKRGNAKSRVGAL